MAKLDGMNPELVRKLLDEIQRACTTMRDVEAEVTQLLTRARVPVHVTYHPRKVAEDLEAMTRKVHERLALLEKQEKSRSGNGNTAAGKSDKFLQEPDITMPADDPKPDKPKPHDGAKPDHKADHKADQKVEHKTDHKTSHKADHKPDQAGRHSAAGSGTGEGRSTHPTHSVGQATPGGGSGTHHSTGAGSADSGATAAAHGAGSGSQGTGSQGASSGVHGATGDTTLPKIGDQTHRAVDGLPAQIPPTTGERVAADPPIDHNPGDPNVYGPGTPATPGVGTDHVAGAGRTAGDGAMGGGVMTCQCCGAGVCRCGMANGTGVAAVGGTPIGGTTTDGAATVGTAAGGMGTGGAVPSGGVADGSATGSGVAGTSYAGTGQGAAHPSGAGPLPGADGVTGDAGVATAGGHNADSGAVTGSGGVVGGGTNTGGGTPPEGSQIMDTPRVDQSDDADPAVGQQVIVVDGVKVVSTPLNQPVSEMPGTGGHSAGTGPHPDGPPGFVEPLEPSHPASGSTAPGHASAVPAVPGHATAGHATAGHGAPAQTGSAHVIAVSPAPGHTPADAGHTGPDHTGPDHTGPAHTGPAHTGTGEGGHAGLAPGDPMGDFVGTPADNATEDALASGAAAAVPGIHGGHAVDDGHAGNESSSHRRVVDLQLDTRPDGVDCGHDSVHDNQGGHHAYGKPGSREV